MTLLMFSWSLLVSLSRIYLGVHYPGDVLGGMLVGGLYALLFWGRVLSGVQRHPPHCSENHRYMIKSTFLFGF